MAKDSKQTDIKIDDKVTLSGTVVAMHDADASPCQVQLDGASGYPQPIVSLESPLLTVVGATGAVDPPKPETIKTPAASDAPTQAATQPAPSPPASDKPAQPTK